jgi:hypothetical protein
MIKNKKDSKILEPHSLYKVNFSRLEQNSIAEDFLVNHSRILLSEIKQ